MARYRGRNVTLSFSRDEGQTWERLGAGAVNLLAEQVAQERDRQRENYLLRYLGLDPDCLALDGYTLAIQQDYPRRATRIEIRGPSGNTVRVFYVGDEYLEQSTRGFRGVTQAFASFSTAAVGLTGALAEFGRSAVEAAAEAEREYQRLRVMHGPPCDCPDCTRCRQQYEEPGTSQEYTEADARARDLLLSCLTPAQQEEYVASLSFVVKVESGNCYRIERHRNYNVIRLDGKGQPVAEICAGPVEEVPIEDQMLAQKLLLETDEAGFLAMANRRKIVDYPSFRGIFP